MKLRLYTIVLGVAALALGACSSDETTDGAGGGSDGGAGVGGSGNTGNDGGAGNTGNDGGAGNAGGGTGGGGDCWHCGNYITDCLAGDAPPPECESQDLCAGESGDLYDTWAACICANCATECENTCAGMMGDTMCSECGLAQSMAGGMCADDFAACGGDIE